jgi:hypothetical protein
LQAWKRAHEALRLIERLVRDGSVGLVAYDEEGGRIRYFQGSTEVISMLLLPPDESAAGLIEYHSGTTMTCEIDLSRLKLRPKSSSKPGRKQLFARFRELAEAAVEHLGPHAPNAEIKAYILAHIPPEPYPSKSTANEIIGRAKEIVTARWGAKSVSGQLPVGRL